MDAFSISQIAQFSGIKPHTIRMWEKRYDALQPDRTEGNTRSYNGNQLRRLLNIVSLKGNDYKVSELGRMPDERLFELVRALQKNQKRNEPNEYLISQLIAAGMSYNETYFEKIFSHCLLRYSMKEAYKKIIYPLLIRLGLMWSGNTLPPAHEHFISNIIRQKLFTAIDALPPVSQDSESWLLFLNENEFHDLGLLFSNYLIRRAGHRVIYLGSNVPMKSFVNTVKNTKPDNILLFLVHTNFPESIADYLTELIDRVGKQHIYVAAHKNVIKRSKVDEKIIWLSSVGELERNL